MSIYLHKVKSRWQPGENTLSYFPLKSNADDVIGTRGLTLGGTTISDGVANISAKTSYMLLSNTIGGTNMTASLWYYPTAFNSSGNGDWNTIFARNGGTYHHLLISGGNSAEGTVGRVGFWNNSWTGSSAVLNTNEWYNIIITKSGTNEKIYVNGALVLDSNSSFDNAAYQLGIIANYTNSNGDQGAHGKISEVIFEDKVWSAEEIEDYYMLTKGDYYTETPWEVNEHTVAYYPFKEDILDHSGNNKDFTGSGYSFDNNMITTTSTLTGPIVTPENTTGDRTINIWCNRNNAEGYSFRGSNSGTDGYLNAKDGENGNRPGASFKTSSWYRNRPSASDLPTMGDMILMTRIKTGATMKLYINGVLASTTTLNTATRSSTYGIAKSSMGLGTFGEIVIEDKVWSAEEVLSYYYQTRNNYVDDPWYPVKECEVQNIYIGEYPNLKLVFDFSKDTSFGDYTYGYTSGGGLSIETSNGWVTDGGSSYGNGSVYKTIPGGAKKVWTRVLFNFLDTSTSSTRGGGICLYPFSSSIAYGSNIAVQTAKELSIADADVQKNVVNPVLSLGTDYYLDFKFDNGVFDAILTDMNNNVVSSTTYTNISITSIPTVGFSMWNHANTPKFCRIKKFWAAYES